MSYDYEASSTTETLTEWMMRFDSIWDVDFEFLEDGNHHPVPLCMYARERRSGTEIMLWRDQLRKCRQAPFGTGPRDLMISYASNAELSCFMALNWDFPVNIFDAFVETIATINGDTNISGLEKRRPKLLETLTLFGLEGRSIEDKDRMLDLILQNTEHTPEQRQEIQDGNRADVIDMLKLVPQLQVPSIEHALFRGRYMKAVAVEEWRGLPIDPRLDLLVENWERIQLFYIARDDEFGLYEGTSFREARLEALADSRGWAWPRTPTGRVATSGKAFADMAKRYPELKKAQRLRDQIAELRISNLVNTIGDDNFSRCPLLPFWTVTGRNQPAGRNKIFLPSLPSWLHGLIAPPPGWGLAELDWDGQEYAIMAGYTGDPGMIADYGDDPHLGFAKRAGLAPQDATKKSHGEQRQKIYKPIVLGQLYGMSPFGIAAKTKKSLMWSRNIWAQHRQLYSIFHRRIADTIAQAKFDGSIESPFGWPMIVTAATKNRTLLNYIAQAGGSDMMRIVSIAAMEAGVRVCVPIHDAFWIAAPLDELDDAIARMKDIMIRTGEAVTGGLRVGVTVEYIVRWPNCLGDVREPEDKGQAMWNEVWSLIPNLQQKIGG